MWTTWLRLPSTANFQGIQQESMEDLPIQECLAAHCCTLSDAVFGAMQWQASRGWVCPFLMTVYVLAGRCGWYDLINSLYCCCTGGAPSGEECKSHLNSFRAWQHAPPFVLPLAGGFREYPVKGSVISTLPHNKINRNFFTWWGILNINCLIYSKAEQLLFPAHPKGNNCVWK